MTPFDKIKALLQSDDLMNVNMGIELLDSLVTEPEQILQALGIETEVSSVDDLKAVLDEFEHKGTILVWTLGKWAELGVDWVLKLESLNLDRNQLTSIPEQIQTLTNLTTLYLDGNELTSLPEQIGLLTNLTILNLESNEITCVPGQIQHLTNLTYLNLDSNELTSLPEQIQHLTNLITLDLGGNEITCVPEQIQKLTKLERLYLKKNNIPDEEKSKLKSLLPNCRIRF